MLRMVSYQFFISLQGLSRLFSVAIRLTQPVEGFTPVSPLAIFTQQSLPILYRPSKILFLELMQPDLIIGIFLYQQLHNRGSYSITIEPAGALLLRNILNYGCSLQECQFLPYIGSFFLQAIPYLLGL